MCEPFWLLQLPRLYCLVYLSPHFVSLPQQSEDIQKQDDVICHSNCRFHLTYFQQHCQRLAQIGQFPLYQCSYLMWVPIIFLIKVLRNASVAPGVALVQGGIICSWLSAQEGREDGVEMQERRCNAFYLLRCQQRGLFQGLPELQPFLLGDLGDCQQVVFSGASLEGGEAGEEGAL